MQLSLPLTVERLLANFPFGRHPVLRSSQQAALELIAAEPGSVTLELPVGTGKTDLGYTFLRTVAQVSEGPLFYLVPNKTLVDEVRTMHPDMQPMFGRREYECFYYGMDGLYRADEIPCHSLRNCEHRVDQQTGETHLGGVRPCPYLAAKFATKSNGRLIVCTTAYYLYGHFMARNFTPPAAMVIDEAHQFARSIRGALSYDITDWHLRRAVKLLQQVGAHRAATTVDNFLQTMIATLRRKSPHNQDLLSGEELDQLIAVLSQIDATEITQVVSSAVADGRINPVEDRETLQHLETVVFSLRRYVASFEYAQANQSRPPLNYVTYAYTYTTPQGKEKVQYRLVVRAYQVAPMVRRMISPLTLAYSGTIGNPKIFGFETGVTSRFHSLTGSFPAENTRILLPTDTPNLASGRQQRAEPTKTLRRIARLCRRLRDNGHRSLVVVVSEVEREKFLRLCREENVAAMSYSDDLAPREVVAKFKAGDGDVLVGTSANYGEGLDLPNGIAPVTFFLRPGYPSPVDPATQFEVQRFGRGQAWALWNWRVMIEALQVRGRNVRSAQDKGVTIFVSQQFQRIVFPSLPEWLRPSYRNTLSLDECGEEALRLLAR